MLTIIMPVYNGEKTLKRSVDSILNQTYRDFELIIVNDGSDDSTLDIINKYAKSDSRVKIIDQPNQGQGMARNNALDAAVGDYVGFVDADDEIDSKMYETMINSVGDADICQCGILDIMPDGTQRVQLYAKSETVIIKDRHKYFEEYMIPMKHSFESCNKIFSLKFLNDNNLRFGDNKKVYSEDLYLNIQAAKCLNKIVFIEKPFYKYYQIMTSHSKRKNIDDAVKMCKIYELVYDEEFKYEISRHATISLLVRASVEPKKSSLLTKREDVRKYIKNTITADKRFHYRCILMCVLYAPRCISNAMIDLYFGQKLAVYKEKIKNIFKN